MTCLYFLCIIPNLFYPPETSEPRGKLGGAGGNEPDGSNEEKEKVSPAGQEERGKKSPEIQVEIPLGTILLRVLQLLQFNAHEVAGWDERLSKSCFIGGGLFPTLAFFNHSCNPAIVR